MWKEEGIFIDNVEGLRNAMDVYRSKHKFANEIKLKLQIEGNTITTENGSMGVGFLNNKWVVFDGCGSRLLSYNGNSNYFNHLTFSYNKNTYEAKFEKGGNLKVIGMKATPNAKFLGICGGVVGGIALIVGLSVLLIKHKK